MIALDWIDVYNVADSAANLLAERRTKNHPNTDPDVRSILRRTAVNSLRALWKSGNREARQLVIARVMVWCRYNSAEPDGSHEARIERIEERLGLARKAAA